MRRYRVAVEPGEGVECLICGDVMRQLQNHLKTHGTNTREYREKFPGAEIFGSVMKAIRRDMYVDWVADGQRFHREAGVCANGHKLTKANTLPKRQCRQCHREKRAAWYEANRERVREYNRAYRAANRERLAEYDRTERPPSDPVALRKYKREWARRNRQKKKGTA